MDDHVIHRYHTAFLRMRDAEKAAGQKEFDAGGTGPAMGFGGGSLVGEALGESPRGFKAGTHSSTLTSASKEKASRFNVSQDLSNAISLSR